MLWKGQRISSLEGIIFRAIQDVLANVIQIGGAQKSQGGGILRAQEGCTEAVGGGTERCQSGWEGERSAC